MTNILYNDLKTLISASNLVPGEQYRITDYVTTISKTDYTSGNHVFDVVVTALDTNTLYDYAKALQHEGDTYFDGVNFALWSIKYNIDNIIPGYTNNWVDPLGKGCIYYMADEFANEAPFDFKNIKHNGKYLYSNLAGTDNSLHGQSFDNSIKDLIVDGEFIIPTAQYTGDCYNIEFGYNCDRLTVYNSHDVNLGDNNYDVIIGNSNIIQIGDDNNDVTIIGTTTGNIGSGNGRIEIDNGHIITIGDHNTNVDLGNNNSGTVIGDNNNDIIVGTDVTGIVIVDGNTDITIGNDNNDVTIEDSNTVVTGDDNTGVTVNTGNGVTLGSGNGKLTISGGKTVVIGNNTHQIVIGGGTDIVVEDDVTDVDVNPDVVDITIGVGDTSGEGTTIIGQDGSGSTTITNGDQTVVVDPITGDVTIVDPIELPKDILRYSPQTLTPEQQLQARTNIGVGGGDYELTYDDVVDALTYVPISTDKIGVANGLATLDAQGYVLNAQLPSYVDDIIEVDTFTLLPITGEKGKIYIVTDSGKTYRWATTQYVTISESLTLGTGSEQAYPGNLGAALRIDVDGKANISHTHTKAEVGLANVDNTSDLLKPISTATQSALNSKANTSHTHTKSEVGLSNVDNTSDSAKPISNATQTALNSKANASHTHNANAITSGDLSLDRLYLMKKYIASRGENLVTNGTGLLKDNTNFSSMTFTGEESYNCDGSFTTTSVSWIKLDESMPVNPDLAYRLLYYVKAKPWVDSAVLVGIACYDTDGLEIMPNMTMYYPNTLTTLAEDLKDGDTTVKFTNLTNNWINIAGVGTHIRSLIFWNYVDSYGKSYPELTYSRNSFLNSWDPGSVNYATNTITLNKPWSNGTIVAGTKVSNGSSGGTYKYLGEYNYKPTTEWTAQQDIISGIDTSGSNYSKSFHPGTASIKLIFGLNRDVNGGRHYISNISFGIETHPDAVLYDSIQSLSNPQKTQARTNIGAGTSSFSGSYNDLSNKPNTLGGYGITDAYTKTDTDTAINAIEVGGRNLIPNTKDLTGYPYRTSDTYLGFNIARTTKGATGYLDTFSTTTIDIAAGSTYIASFYAKASVNTPMACHWYSPNTTTSSLTSTGYASTSADGTAIIQVTTEWKKYWVVWTQTLTELPKSLIIGRNATIAGAVLEIAGVKLEKGNKATDWTPAPEDQVTDWNVTDVNSFAYLKNKPTSMPASDVYAWAKASTKPSYTFNDITSKPNTLTGYGIPDVPNDNKTYGRKNSTWSEIDTSGGDDSKADKMTKTSLTGLNHTISLIPNTYYYFSGKITKITITDYSKDVGDETVLEFIPDNPTVPGTAQLVFPSSLISLKPIDFIINKRTIVVIKGNILLYTQSA